MPKNKNKLRPEQLDAKMDALDIIGLDDIERRLPLIEGVEYVRPPNWAEIFRDDDGLTVPTTSH